MTTLLQLNTSLFSAGGQSTQLANDFVQNWQRSHADARVITRDLAADSVPHLNAERLQAFMTAAEQRTPAQRDIVAFSDALIAELQSADVLVIGLPLYNFGIPSSLQAYFDHLARAGVTFNYTASGPVGIMKGKRVLVFATRGGKYAGTAQDNVTTQVRSFLSLLGMTDVEFIYAEGLNIDADTRAQGLQTARQHSAQLAQSPAYA
ncbi:MAG: NAD(P)H-dependent oxidoreductase [Steroidobacteraceae bacterium]